MRVIIYLLNKLCNICMHENIYITNLSAIGGIFKELTALWKKWRQRTLRIYERNKIMMTYIFKIIFFWTNKLKNYKSHILELFFWPFTNDDRIKQFLLGQGTIMSLMTKEKRLFLGCLPSCKNYLLFLGFLTIFE